MDLNEIVTLVVALYGAVLATILAVKEFTKERKRIKLFLNQSRAEDGKAEWVLSIVNIGHRPTTITEIEVGSQKVKDKAIGIWDFKVGQFPDILPKIIADGEQVTVTLPNDIFHFPPLKRMDSTESNSDTEPFYLKIVVSDAEMNTYERNETWEYFGNSLTRRYRP